MDLTVEGADAERLQAEVMEGVRYVEAFARRFFDRVGAKVVEERPGILDVTFPKGSMPVQKQRHLLTFDPELYSEVEDQGAELITPASPLFRNMLSLSDAWGPLGLLRDTKRGTPYTMLHFDVRLEGTNYEWEGVISVGVDDDGDELPEERDVEYLLNGVEEGRLDVIDPATVPESIRKPPAMALDRGPVVLRSRLAPKLDELAGAVEAGLRKTHERIHSYYEQMRDEIRGEEVRLRRRIGELNSKLWYVEDRMKRMALEKEREVLTEDLNAIKQKTQKSLEQLEFEENERLAKESERAQPKVKLTLVAATRVVT